MKANELMTGDWVLYGGEPNIITEVSEIIHGEATVCFAGNNYMANIDEIKPIPLTKEILEKNGFKLHHKDRFHAADYYVYWKGGEREGTAIVVRFFEPDAGGVKVLVRFEMESFHKLGINTLHSCDIEYVHELQNAIRLYKIDKEIEL